MPSLLRVELRCDTPEFSEPMEEIDAILREMVVRLKTAQPHWGGYYHGQLKDKAKNHVGYYTLSLDLEKT